MCVKSHNTLCTWSVIVWHGKSLTFNNWITHCSGCLKHLNYDKQYFTSIADPSWTTVCMHFILSLKPNVHSLRNISRFHTLDISKEHFKWKECMSMTHGHRTLFSDWRQKLLVTDLFCKKLCGITENHSKISKTTLATLPRHSSACIFVETKVYTSVISRINHVDQR